MNTYKVLRFFADETPAELIATGLTYEEARAHCKSADTHGNGWFDGFTEE